MIQPDCVLPAITQRETLFVFGGQVLCLKNNHVGLDPRTQRSGFNINVWNK